MDREYDIFEKLPGVPPIWRDHVRGALAAHSRLIKLAETCDHEFYVMDVPNREVLERANSHKPNMGNG